MQHCCSQSLSSVNDTIIRWMVEAVHAYMTGRIAQYSLVYSRTGMGRSTRIGIVSRAAAMWAEIRLCCLLPLFLPSLLCHGCVIVLLLAVGLLCSPLLLLLLLRRLALGARSLLCPLRREWRPLHVVLCSPLLAVRLLRSPPPGRAVRPLRLQ